MTAFLHMCTSIAADSSPNPIKFSLNLIYVCLGKRHPYKLYGCVEPSSYAHCYGGEKRKTNLTPGNYSFPYKQHQQPPQDKYKRRKYHYEENTHECQADDLTLHY
uniref:Uncharacterized protein n=1 Tax=Glossina austeni TaxID=7395 RepID=A0A1A9UIN2_GLOAU